MLLVAGAADAPPPFAAELAAGARVARLAPEPNPVSGRPPAEDPALCAAVERAPLVLQGGGDGLDWWAALHPAGKASPLVRSLERALAREGVVVVAAGGARHALTPGLVARERLGRPARNPRRRHADVAVAGPLAALERLTAAAPGELAGGDGELRRLLHPALADARAERALLVGDVAWIPGGAAREACVLGPGVVLLVDVRAPGSTRGADTLAELTILRATDDRPEGGREPSPDPPREPARGVAGKRASTGSAAPADLPSGAPPSAAAPTMRERRVADALDARTLVAATSDAFSAESSRALRLVDERTVVELELRPAPPSVDPSGRAGTPERDTAAAAPGRARDAPAPARASRTLRRAAGGAVGRTPSRDWQAAEERRAAPGRRTR